MNGVFSCRSAASQPFGASAAPGASRSDSVSLWGGWRWESRVFSITSSCCTASHTEDQCAVSVKQLQDSSSGKARTYHENAIKKRQRTKRRFFFLNDALES